jgi:hypothetical protein
LKIKQNWGNEFASPRTVVAAVLQQSDDNDLRMLQADCAKGRSSCHMLDPPASEPVKAAAP